VFASDFFFPSFGMGLGFLDIFNLFPYNPGPALISGWSVASMLLLIQNGSAY